MTFHHSHFVAGDQTRTPLLLLHGTGADEFDLIPLARQITPDAPLFSVRGNVIEHGHKRYFHRNADGSFHQEDLEKRTHELADFIREAAPQHGIDPAKMIVLGFSNGANIASSLFFRASGLLRGGILLRGMIPFVPKELPGLKDMPILLQSGIDDPLIPYDRAVALAEIYRRSGAVIAHNVLPTGHGLIADDVIQAKHWYNAL